MVDILYNEFSWEMCVTVQPDMRRTWRMVDADLYLIFCLLNWVVIGSD